MQYKIIKPKSVFMLVEFKLLIYYKKFLKETWSQLLIYISIFALAFNNIPSFVLFVFQEKPCFWGEKNQW